MNRHKLDLKLFKRLFVYLRPYKIQIIIAIVLILFARLIDALVPLWVGSLAQTILTGDVNQKPVIQNGLILVALLILGYLFDLIDTLLKSWIGSRAMKKLRVDVYNHIQRLPTFEFDKEPVGKLMTRVMNDVDQINQMFSESLVPLIGNLFLFFMILGAMFYLDYRIALIIMVILPLVLTLTNYFRNIQRTSFDRIRKEMSRMNSFIQEHLAGVMVIRHFHLESQEKAKFDEINADLSAEYLKTNNNFSLYISGNDFLQSSALIGAYFILALQGPFDAGIFFSFTLYIMMIFRPLGELAERYNTLQSAFAASDRIFEMMDREVERSSGLSIHEVETVEFKNVSFYYREGEWILKDFNFKVDKGESVALVGQTGSGKTTVISLILRFYPIQNGEILINGRPHTEYNLKELRQCFGVILQDPVLFSGTVRENVTLFNANIPDKEIIKALEYVGLPASFIDKDILERGKSLSSGEMQLLSLARVHCLQGKFLLLDEATANIDPITEKKIQETIDKILKGRGAIVVAHRLTTIRDSKIISVMSKGQVIEKGSHDDLIAKKGVYEKLYRLQFTQ